MFQAKTSNNGNQGFPEGVFFDEQTLQQSLVHPNAGQMNKDVGGWTSNYKPGQYLPDVTREPITQNPMPQIKPPSFPQVNLQPLQPALQQEQKKIVPPDGKKMEMTNQDARQYPHGMFQGSTSTTSQGFSISD